MSHIDINTEDRVIDIESKDNKFTHTEKIKYLDDAIKAGGYYGSDGTWNSIVVFSNDKHVYRSRVETLIIKDHDYIFLKFLSKNNDVDNRVYLIPGGSTAKDVLNIDQAVNECKEEAKILVKNIQSTGITYKEITTPPKWAINSQAVNWNGNFTEIYVAEYDKKYDGHIDKVDQDKFMASGRFYEINKVYPILKKEHKDALKLIYPNRFKRLSKDKNIVVEKPLTAKERNKLDDSQFGIPSLRKYPLHDKKHVILAIRMFNRVDRYHERELAKNIISAMNKYNIKYSIVGEYNRLRTYL